MVLMITGLIFGIMGLFLVSIASIALRGAVGRGLGHPPRQIAREIVVRAFQMT